MPLLTTTGSRVSCSDLKHTSESTAHWNRASPDHQSELATL